VTTFHPLIGHFPHLLLIADATMTFQVSALCLWRFMMKARFTNISFGL